MQIRDSNSLTAHPRSLPDAQKQRAELTGNRKPAAFVTLPAHILFLSLACSLEKEEK